MLFAMLPASDAEDAEYEEPGRSVPGDDGAVWELSVSVYEEGTRPSCEPMRILVHPPSITSQCLTLDTALH